MEQQLNDCVRSFSTEVKLHRKIKYLRGFNQFWFVRQPGLLPLVSIVCALQINYDGVYDKGAFVMRIQTHSWAPEKASPKCLALSEVLNGAQPVILQNPFC